MKDTYIDDYRLEPLPQMAPEMMAQFALDTLDQILRGSLMAEKTELPVIR